MIAKGEIAFGDIVWAEFDPSIGHEYRNKRPAIVIQAEEQLKKSNLVTVIPLTSQTDKPGLDDILVEAERGNNLLMNSLARVYCITSFDYARFDKVIGKISPKIEELIKGYLKKHFGL